tara:strand:- start:133 stop:954 length:822 start_codon:yes stop_codon:yes gene_type:complete
MHLRILSLGAGVQSTTLALMIEKGEVPMVDCAVFSDVRGEPQKVYDHLDWLEKQLSYPLHRVTWRDLKQDVLDASIGKYKGFTAPFYTLSDKGKKGMLMRQCTADYKIKPINQKMRELLGYKKGERVKGDTVEMIMGISYDELFRMRMNRLKYVTNVYPLVEKEIRRHHCLQWMEKHGYPTPPRSACTFCPYHSNHEWREIKKNKKEWDEVVALDKAIRNTEDYKGDTEYKKVIRDKLYLHRDCKPIDEVDLRSDEEKGQMSLLDECEGMCGV